MSRKQEITIRGGDFCPGEGTPCPHPNAVPPVSCIYAAPTCHDGSWTYN